MARMILIIRATRLIKKLLNVLSSLMGKSVIFASTAEGLK